MGKQTMGTPGTAIRYRSEYDIRGVEKSANS